MTLQLVHRFSQVRPFYNALRERRGDIALVGDSNMQVNSVGHAVAAPRSWGRRFGWYATGVHGTNSVSNYTRNYKALFGDGSTFDTVPGTHTAYSWAEIPGPLYIAGAFAEPFAFNFAAIEATHPMSGRAMNWRFRYGVGPAWGTFKPAVRRASTFDYRASTSIAAANATNGMAAGVLSVPAETWGADYWFSFQGYSNAHSPGAASGPFYSNYQRIEFPDALHGVAVSAFYAQGGVGTRHAAVAIQAMTQTQFNEWKAIAVGYQNARPIILFDIIEGANDTGFPTLSVGPNPAAGDTVEGVVDNHVAFIEEARDLWVGSGGDLDDCYFTIGGYHPQEYSRAQWKRDLDEALNAYVDGENNIARISDVRISTSAFFSARGMYAGAYPDDAHDTAQGYYDWHDMRVAAIVPTPGFVEDLEAAATYYLRLFDGTGRPYDAATKSFGPWDDTLVLNYAIAGVRNGATSTSYRFELPEDLVAPAGMHGIIYEQGGGSPALADVPMKKVDATAFDGLRIADAATLAERLDESEAAAATLSATIDAIATKVATIDATAGSATGGSVSIEADLDAGTDDDFAVDFNATGLVSTGWSKWVFTVKANPETDGDEDALLVVRVTAPASGSDGLLLVNGQPAADAADGAITVTATTPDTLLSVEVAAAGMAILPSPEGKPYTWELTRWIGAAKRRVGTGLFTVDRTLRRDPAAP